MKQTAVEWYEKEINSLIEEYESGKISKRDFITMKHNLFYPAKEMEKQQIIDALKEGVNFEINNSHSTQINYKKHFEKYYNETFNK
jgi:hypothetical protein